MNNQKLTSIPDANKTNYLPWILGGAGIVGLIWDSGLFCGKE